MEDFKRLLHDAGRWGKYQKILGLLMIMTSSYIPIIVVVLPLNHGSFDFDFQGVSYKTQHFNDTSILSNQTTQYFCEEIFPTYSFEDIFDDITVHSSYRTWATELKFICNSKQIFSLLGTGYFLGAIAAYLSFMKIPDRFGRELLFKVLNVVSFFCLFQLLYLVSFFQLMISAFVLGMSSINMSIAAVILNENMEKEHTSVIMGIANAAFPFFGILNTTFFYFFHDWRPTIYLIILNSFLLNVICLFYLKESPTWLFANSKRNQLIETMKFIAATNGVEGNLEEYKHLMEQDEKKEKDDFEFKFEGEISVHEVKIRYSIVDLIYYPSVRYFTLSNLFLWAVSGFSFYGIFLNIEGMTGHIFLDAIVSYSAEFIAELISGHLAVVSGRKTILFYSFMMAAVGCLANILFTKVLFMQMVMIFLAAMGISSAFNVLYIYSAEIFPTNIKSLALSCFSLLNRLSGGSVPVILNYTSNILPIIGFFSILSTIIMYFLPESITYEVGDEVLELEDKMIFQDELSEGTKNPYFGDLLNKSN